VVALLVYFIYLHLIKKQNTDIASEEIRQRNRLKNTLLQTAFSAILLTGAID